MQSLRAFIVSVLFTSRSPHLMIFLSFAKTFPMLLLSVYDEMEKYVNLTIILANLVFLEHTGEKMF